MIKVGFEPFLECSSRGDRRFSAFNARPSTLGGKSIEEVYQASKVFSDGSTGLSWREAKGRKAVNQEAIAKDYKENWKTYILEKDLLKVLKAASGLSDMFGQVGHVCQALVLWELRNEL